MKKKLKKIASNIKQLKMSRRIGLSFLCFFVSLFLLYALLGFWILPSYIKSKAESVAVEKLHRNLVIKEIEFNPFTFRASIEGFKLSEPNSKENFVTFDQLMVDVSPFSVLRMTPVITEFKLVKPFVRLVRVSEKERNFDDIYALFSSTEETKLSEDKNTQIEEHRPKNSEERRAAIRKRKFGIYNFQVIDAQIDLENKEKGTKTVISKFNIGLPYLYRGPIKGITRFVEPKFEALINGKKLEIVREEPTGNSRDRVLKLNMDNIDLTRIFNYVPFNPAYKFKRGWLDLHLSCHIHRPENAPTSIDIGGQITARSIFMTQSGRPLLDLEKMDVHLGTLALDKQEYNLEKIELIKPKIYAVNDKNGVLNFLNLLVEKDNETSTSQTDNTNTSRQEQGAVALNALLIKKAQLHYEDQSTANNLSLAINNLDVIVQKASFEESKEKDSYLLRFGQVKINNDSIQLKESQKNSSETFPISFDANKLNLNLNNAVIDLGKKNISIENVESSLGNFDVFTENHPPKVPVSVTKEKDNNSLFSIHIGKVNIKNWFAKLNNSNRYDPFEIPFLATISQFGLTVDNVDVNLNDQNVSIGTIASKKGVVNIELTPYQKPTHYGKRAVARAALLTSILEAEKKQPADGFLFNIGKVAVSDWLAQVKNQNISDRAGIPVSGRVDNINFVLDNVKLDTKNRLFNVAEITSNKVRVKGRIEKHEKFVPKQVKESASPVVFPSGSSYTTNIGKLAITDWAIKGRNTNLKKAIGSSVSNLKIIGQDLSSIPGKTNKLSVQALVNQSGTLKLDGRVSFSPLNIDMDLNLKDVSVIGVQPYIDDYVNLTIERANLSTVGKFELKENESGEFAGAYKGDIILGPLNTVDQINKDPFIRWDTLDLKNVNANLNPLNIKIEEAEFNNFYTRVILNSDGRLNLRNILRSEAGGQVSLTESEEELDELSQVAKEDQDKGNVTTKEIKKQSIETETTLPLVVVDKIKLKKGRVRFTDNFIKPHYTANISDMEGTITGFSTNPESVADLDIRGFVNKAPLVAAGTISPLKEHLTLDVKAQVRGMELAQFSSYTTKYIGYGIDKGKLSFDVEYQLNDGVLVAKNRLILDQLTFGEKTSGDAVTSLPVELAVSLLKDGNGVIDINLPIGGSLEDPSFSIGEILAKVFLSSLKRVILSPFAFLSLEFGSNAELAWIDFEPGSFSIPQKEISKLEVLAKALTERPSLKLDITGRYDPVADRTGLAKLAIQRKIKMLKLKMLQEKGEKITYGQVKIEDSEYPILLEQIYSEENFKKPRNLIGIQEKVSVSEMEKLLEENYVVTNEEFLSLAYRRSEYVKDWFVKNGKIAESRIFLLASKAGETGENGEAATRVDFSMQ